MKTITYNNVEIIVYENGIIIDNKTQKPIKFHISNGYLRCRIGSKNEYLHRLIAMCFLENFNSCLSVNHKDGNKLNNDINNLEIISLSENTKHAHKTGLNNNKGELNKSALLTQKQAEEIFILNKPYKEIAKEYNISITMISLIKNKKNWLCIHN